MPFGGRWSLHLKFSEYWNFQYIFFFFKLQEHTLPIHWNEKISCKFVLIVLDVFCSVWKDNNWHYKPETPKLNKKEGRGHFCWTVVAFGWAREWVLDQFNVCDDLFTQPQIFFFVMQLFILQMQPFPHTHTHHPVLHRLVSPCLHSQQLLSKNLIFSRHSL